VVEHASLEGFGSAADRAARLDALMDRASVALVRTDYFQAVELCTTALRRALTQFDYERASRICLPLQEARRQVRQLAADAGAGGARFVVSRESELPKPLAPGCYLVQPPLIGAEGRQLLETLSASRIPAIVVTREPMTRDGRWPLVAVGASIVRTKVDPPAGVRAQAGCVTRDAWDGPPDVAWFEHAGEALGDAAIASVRSTEHAELVRELAGLLEASPDHEKLHQRLSEACRAAAAAGLGPMPDPPSDPA